MKTFWRFLWICSAVILLVILLAPDRKAIPEVKNEKLDYSKPIFTTYRTIVCPTSLFSDVRADHAPDKVVEMFYSLWDRSAKAEKLGCAELQPGLLVKAAPFLEGYATVEISGSAGGSLFTPDDELTNKVPGQSDATRADLATPHINKAPDGPLPPASNDIGRLLVTNPPLIGGPILRGHVMAASDSEGNGAIICPDADTMALAFSRPIDANYKDESVGVWLKPYGCSYLPPGTPMVSEGRNTANTLAIITADLSDGTRINGVTFPNMIVQNQKQREEAESQALAEQQATQQAQLAMQQAQQKRYEEIMEPEEQRHAEAVNQEEVRHDSVVRLLNSTRDSLMSTHPGPSDKGQQLYQNQVAMQQEAARHDAAVKGENQRYSSAQTVARDQASQPRSP
jgi:hypothetical protein